MGRTKILYWYKNPINGKPISYQLLSGQLGPQLDPELLSMYLSRPWGTWNDGQYMLDKYCFVSNIPFLKNLHYSNLTEITSLNDLFELFHVLGREWSLRFSIRGRR